MLTFNLKKQWYEKIRSDEKRIEYREEKDYWKMRLWHHHCLPHLDPFVWDCTKDWSAAPVPCILRLGYTKKHMTADITKIEVVDGKDTDLAIDKPVYAIHLEKIKEVEIEKYRPYTYDELLARRDRWYRLRDSSGCLFRPHIIAHDRNNNALIDNMSAERFLDEYVWEDGSPCGMEIQRI